ncbi:NAD-dependent epimerase/dehydratase family protein [Lujinxingia sediminis]|uniref:NAD-dependent epimerase/dehydratase family protein n=1 Tax=Lujinxingia sediminis TaxID=2480984 RepID=A0ABY0CUQ2_9DELT|nr:SDR family oxidoreductase [Lujinxingia sediminis]RVU44874.1 NAD-dependent epimerase/dehydratase family protein [Lujinxingia sediminis]
MTIPETIDRPILMTGFPGFLATHLVETLAQHTEASLDLLVLASEFEQASRRLARLIEEYPSLQGRARLVRGDITREALGLSKADHERLRETVGVVWHLAAIYDLAVPRDVAFKVNVGGTRHVLDFCEACTNLERLNYVSTCYVSGDRRGTFREDELDLGQGFKNHYEETKFWAEVEVQRRASEIPTTIFRPGITVGDSRTGATEKFDGPYYVFGLLERLPEWLPIPNVGRGEAKVNIVPIDVLVAALAALGHEAGNEGQVFQLADPNPMRSRDIIERTLEHMGRNPAVGSVPESWVEKALANTQLESWTGVPQEALAYFNHPAHYDTRKATAALARHGIEFPHLSFYLPTLLDAFARRDEAPHS